MSETGNAEAAENGGRPEHVPEKFWNADTNQVNTDALLKSYGELERQGSGGTEEPAGEPSGEPSGDDDQRNVEQAVEGFTKFEKEFADTGKLTDESYKNLEDQGFDKETVDDFIKYRSEKVSGFEQSIFEAAGGQEKLEAMIEWVQESGTYTQEQGDAFDRAMRNDKDPHTAKLFVEKLVSQYNKANGSDGMRENAGGAEDAGVDQFPSFEAYLTEVKKPDYQKDPSVRAAVDAKLKRSPKALVKQTVR